MKIVQDHAIIHSQSIYEINNYNELDKIKQEFSALRDAIINAKGMGDLDKVVFDKKCENALVELTKPNPNWVSLKKFAEGVQSISGFTENGVKIGEAIGKMMSLSSQAIQALPDLF